MSLSKLNIALVCDWLTSAGGAEKVILALHRLFPSAPIFTSVYNPGRIHGFEQAKVITSYLQHMPFAKKRHQFYLGLMPHVFESFNLNDFDIVISSSHSCAKGIITKPETMHVSYCHSPMRYAWENSINYIKQYKINSVAKKGASFLMHKIRLWDRLSADRVDHFIANSHHIQQRIHKYYRRPSTVIYPHVDVDRFQPGTEREKYFVAVGRLTPYKRFDLLIETFNELGLPLKIVGTGIAEKELQKKAKENIEFLGYVTDEELSGLLKHAKALVFPQLEDFGITPLEAMASGCPVIAFKKGGALETIIEGKTGIFFNEQNAHSVKKAIREFENHRFNHKNIRQQAEKFSEERFRKEIVNFLEKKWTHWQSKMNP